jgi:aspartate kinase
MGRLVQKFGSATVGDVERIRRCAEIAVKAASEGHEVMAVVSSMGESSDRLNSLATQITGNPGNREMDMLLATGDQMSVALMSMAIQSMGGAARAFTGTQSGIITEQKNGATAIKEINCLPIESALARGEIAVVAGRQGVSESAEITTITHGGANVAAIALASSFGAERCDIYTNVRGVCTTDPNILSKARLLPAISYEEMLELSATGTPLMSVPALEMAMDTHLPIRVRSLQDPDNLGTLITHRLVAPENTVCAISLDLRQASLTLKSLNLGADENTLEGISALFTRLGELNITTDMVMLLTREDEPAQELSMTIDRHSIARVRAIIDSLSNFLGAHQVRTDTEIARISVIGRRLTSHPEVVAAVFDTLNHANIPVQMVATSDLRVSVLLPSVHSAPAVKLLHDRFMLDESGHGYQ